MLARSLEMSCSAFNCSRPRLCLMSAHTVATVVQVSSGCPTSSCAVDCCSMTTRQFRLPARISHPQADTVRVEQVLDAERHLDHVVACCHRYRLPIGVQVATLEQDGGLDGGIHHDAVQIATDA